MTLYLYYIHIHTTITIASHHHHSLYLSIHITEEELAAQQALYESQLQDYFFQFLPCALGGSQNLECCQNLDAILGPYPTADLHNCLCLPGAFDALVEGSQGMCIYTCIYIHMYREIGRMREGRKR